MKKPSFITALCGAIIIFLMGHSAAGQTDSLVFDQDNRFVGEIKNMQQGVLEIDTDYADENIKIKWLSISEIYTQNRYLISTQDELYTGRMETVNQELIRIFDKDSTLLQCRFEDIISVIQLKEGFANRFSAAVELGYNLAKAQDLRQFSLRSSVGYKTAKWSLFASYNWLRSTQEETESVQRTDGLLDYRRLIYNKWYAVATIATLSNTEQNLDIRANSRLGVGNYIFSNSKAYWGIKTGVNNNLEKFETQQEARNSWEAFLGTELNLFNLGDLELTFVFLGYTGLTDSGRYRADTNLDLKYDLPWDLFIRMGFSLNYDNQPAADAPETDYILRTGIGWEW